ncbi:helix-hairpin-helix domain-containing protein [Amphibacillus sp. MSJ-3]|uniref:helix-hairpin-helix domain-containing protein n=1 Tax=Amphibacillus sp. MSJ-3 TaxID=2841505 RepID=UPI001C0F2193|nr:helix-hairpin-helix domain-containing protein [Amphibacillus sp. MSJ-3]
MKWIKDNLIIVIVCLILLFGILWELFRSDWLQPSVETSPINSSVNHPTSSPFESSPENENIPNQEKVYVDIKGEVHQPGVYLVDPNDRVIDVIESAGGFTDRADENQINLAEKVYDEMVIFVLDQSESEDLTVQSDSNHDKIRINQASQTELEQLPGIGEAKALAIIQYREENGPFREAEELKNISGIGEKTFEKLAEYVIVP